MTENIEKILSVYRMLSKIPTITSGRIIHNGSVVISNWSERNLEKHKMTKFSSTHFLDNDLKVVAETPFAIDTSNEIISCITPSENEKVIIREHNEPKKQQFLEIWNNKQISKCIDLTALEIHGDVYVDSEFGSLDLNNAGDQLVYIAEKDLPKSEPFYKRISLKKKPAINGDQVSKGTEYDLKQEWGEQLVGKHLSSLIVCQTKTEEFTVIDWLPKSFCPGQVSWTPNNSLIGVAWETEPRRLGLIFCTNRPSYIFHTSLDKTHTIVSKPGKAVRSPRISQDINAAKYLVWLQRDINGPHHTCHQLVKTNWPLTSEPKIDVVIDTVNTYKNIENGTFTGIYALSLPKRAFALDGKRVIFSTPQQNEVRSYVVDLETGKITDISYTSIPCSTTVLDVCNDIILACRSSVTIPDEIIVARLPSAGSENIIKWTTISSNSFMVPEHLSNAVVEYIELNQDSEKASSIKNFTAIYTGPTSMKNMPLVVYPHGGPHSSFFNAYRLETALYIMLGFSMIQINYRGSTGAGTGSVEFLSGNVGKTDVSDCILATDKTIELYPIDRNKCVLMGRSHGGFLVTHLSGQYPDKFKAVVAGNPVTDIASMMNSTDIPDWCAYEAGEEFQEIGQVSTELLLKMREDSPLAHAHKVKAPTLLCLGSKDKRVPYFQGLDFYNKIHANGCKARVLVYEDNHALSLNAIELDHVINGALWLLEHTQSN